ncbi:MAG: exodeoxyribonuclease VII small subunit [Rhodospirillaceae bacterium]|nr:exodeoxyribonuclease VII small subunit [Rhodospirillaceae bacterium]MDE0000561.1 exodeoxyribonuclease VII small subunit [Rhodospirillaceae bacterium]MDE0361870.1 exodeoxyribonuclease VII small subunit [Rhodospirillaceae bacterium]
MTEESSVAGLEKSLEELEALLQELESGELTLEAALAHFERGVKLTRQCQNALQEAEQKVEILLKKSPEAKPEPFDSADA